MRKTAQLKRVVRRTRTSHEKTFPPPVGGWVANASIASMKPTEAVELVNWFPRPTSVETRMGSTQWHVRYGEIVKTLATWKGLDGTEAFFSVTDSGIYESTYGGVSTDNSLSRWAARTEGKHQWDQFGDGTNAWLILVNGVDKPLYIDGSTAVAVDGVSTPAITGITTTDIVNLAVFKERILFVRNDKLGFDYLAAGAAGGAASFFDLSSVASLGGYLMAIAVWSRDAGNGPDDYAVFITSQGEALVYAGTDPSSANTWSLVGTFRIGKPIGRKCVLKYGADPLILTEGGVFPLSALLSAGDERERFAVSYKIQDAFTKASADTLDTYGWTMVSYPEQDMLLVNVPVAEEGKHYQYVMNTISKAWCKFEGWDAEDWGIFDRQLFYCKGGIIYKAWAGIADEVSSRFSYVDGSDLIVGCKPITYTARQSFQDWGTPAIKSPVMFMPLIESVTNTPYTVGIDSDFTSRPFLEQEEDADSGVMRWGVGRWGVDRWGTSDPIARRWQGASCWPGRWLGGKVKMVTPGVSADGTILLSSGDIVTPIGKWLGSVMRFIVGDAV